MTIPLEKILTIDARTYIESRSKQLCEYEFVGVTVISNHSDVFVDFQKKVPENAEVVTDLSYVGSIEGNRNTYLMGTALIPKSK